MNFYKHHLGDYSKDTAHLSISEHGAYRLLLDYYYSTEAPLPDSLESLCRICRAITRSERAAVERVREFFTPADGKLVHKRVEAELRAYGVVVEKNRRIGKLGGRPEGKQKETQKKPSGFPEGIPKGIPPGFQNETQTKPSGFPEGIPKGIPPGFQNETQTKPKHNPIQNPESRTVPCASSSSDTAQAANGSPAAGGTHQALVSMEEAAASKLAGKDVTKKWWLDMEARGWRDRAGQPVLNWRASLMAYAEGWKKNDRGGSKAKAADCSERGVVTWAAPVPAKVRDEDRPGVDDFRVAKALLQG